MKSLRCLTICVVVLVGFLFGGMVATFAVGSPKKEIQILSCPLGTSGYVLSFALANMINKKSDKFRASCVETKSTTANVMTLATNADKRKFSIIYSSPYTNIRAARADRPFKEPYTGLKFLAKTIEVGIAFITSDKDIKGPQEMIGKRIGLGAKGATVEFGPAAVLKAWGILDKVKVSNLPWGPNKTAFIDGTIDVGIMAFVNVGGDNWKTNPAGSEILASPKSVYFIDMDLEASNKARVESGYPIFATKIPGGTLGAKQDHQIWAQAQSVSWYVDEGMNDEIAYEISKLIWENADKFKEHHATGKGINKENIFMVPGLSEGDVHPGALKFAKEKGLQIGVNN